MQGCDVTLDNERKMVRVDINSDVESESDASLDLEIDSDGATCLFMFKPQHDTNSEEEDSSNHQEMVESDADVLPYCNLVLFCKSCIYCKLYCKCNKNKSDANGAVRSHLGNSDWCACTNDLLPRDGRAG